MNPKLHGKSSWKWYSVKILYESTITGEPNKDKIDENYTDEYKIYEESIILIKAQSFDHAYKLAEKKAIAQELDYYNPYDQLVQVKFVRSLDCFELFDNELGSGTELYSRLIHTPKDIQPDEIVRSYFPETIPEDDNTPDYYFAFRVREFNKVPKPKGR